jgi:hypothetical protein
VKATHAPQRALTIVGRFAELAPRRRDVQQRRETYAVFHSVDASNGAAGTRPESGFLSAEFGDHAAAFSQRVAAA